MAILVSRMVITYAQFVPSEVRVLEETWDFAQIVPFVMTIVPLTELLRTIPVAKRIQQSSIFDVIQPHQRKIGLCYTKIWWERVVLRFGKKAVVQMWKKVQVLLSSWRKLAKVN